MTTILVDYNIAGQAALLWSALEREGWLGLIPVRMVYFADVGLPRGTTDRDIWRYAQAQQMLLLTGNRNRHGADSLQQTIDDENQATSLPVITIGNVDRVVEYDYRLRCIERLVDILLSRDNYLGTGRLYIP